MKRLFSRVLSVLLTLALFVGLISGLALHTSAATYVYNWGTRGTLATELSDSAIAWYASLGATYEGLSALSGSSSVNSVSTSALYKKLADMMTTKHDNPTNYDATKSLFAYTDCQNGGGKISSFYSGKSIGPEWDSGSTWNREHCWPNSKSNGGSDSNTRRETDIMMLRPTSSSENSSRGNTAYGESSGYYHPNGQSGGNYDLRGDVARVVLYVYVRYGTDSQYHDGALNYMWGSSGVMESKDVLIDWMEADPVDTWELGRNDSVQSITGTRNVFVDYPELAFLLFAEDVPADYDSPSNAGKADFTVTATSNNNAYGTVSVSGNTIIASPATGYAATGYTVTNGTATVTQNGNVFTVSASADCSVQINFAARTLVDVIFSESGVETVHKVYVGDSITLPEPTATPSGYTFIGWTTAAVDSATDKPSVTDKGTTLSVSSTITYYALYSTTTGGGGGGSGNYEKVTAAPADWSGEYLIVYEAGSVIFNGSLTTLDAASNNVSVTITDDCIAATAGDAYKFTIATMNGGYSIKSASGYYIGHGSDANKLTASASPLLNTISLNADKSVNIICAGGAYLRYNATASNYRFRYYKSTSYSGQKAITLYRKTVSSGGGSTTVYTTAACAHENQSNVAAQAPTCTEIGYTAGVQCDDCGVFINGHVAVDATGHSYAGVVTPPTAEEDGYTTYTCPDCGDSYVSDYTDALGQTYTVSFSVPAGVAAVNSMSCNNSGITLPTAGAPNGYSFVGWATATVNNVTEKPSFYADGAAYVADGNVTLYALYTYAEEGGGNDGYTLTDIANVQADDVVVITVTTSDGTLYALNNDDAGKGPTASVVTKNGDSLTSEIDDIQKWNIAKEGNNLIIYPNGTTSEWLYCTGDNDGVRVGTNANKTFVIDTTSGYLKHTATSRYLGVYVDGSDWRCYTSYTTDNIKNQTLAFYVLGSGTTYYTTEIGGSTEPDEPDEPDEPEDTYTLSFHVPSGVTRPSAIVANGTVTLPSLSSASIVVGGVTYTFLGWSANRVEDDTVVPSVYTAGANYSLTADTVLYALFEYGVGGGEQTTSYTVSSYAAGTQYAENETHVLDATLTVVTTQAHWTSDLRLYSSSTHNGYAIFQSTKPITALQFNAGNNKDTLNIYGSNDNGATWTLIQGVSITSTSYKDYSVTFATAYKWLKWDVAGSNQVRIKTFALTTNAVTSHYTTLVGGAQMEGATLTLGELLGLNFHTSVKETAVANTTVQFTYYDGRTGADIDPITVTITGDDIDEVTGFYVFTVKLPAVYMATTITAELLVGDVVVQTMTYSIREYAMAIIGGSYDLYDQEDKNAATALLNYGAMAQNYFNYNTGDLANSTLTSGKYTDVDAALGQITNIAQYAAAVTNRTNNFIGYTLLLKDVTYIRLYFTEQVTATVTFKGETKQITATKDGDKARYYVQIDGVNAANLDAANTIVCGDMNITNLSVLSLAAQVAKDASKSDEFRNAMAALILYAQSVDNM